VSARPPWRTHAPSLVVTALGSGFGVGVLACTRILAQAIAHDRVTGQSGTVAVLLAMMSVVFVVVAIYVGAVVTANTFSAVVQARTRTIALLRLLGSSARSQRRAFVREGLLVGIVGAVGGGLLAFGAAAASTVVLERIGVLPSIPYRYDVPLLGLPVLGVVLATVAAAWSGSRAVLTVTPLQALGSARERNSDDLRGRPVRTATAGAAAGLGAAALVEAVVIGQDAPTGILLALVGSVVSFSGIVLGAHAFLPGVLRLVGRLTRGSVAGRLASATTARDAGSSTRTSVGLLIGVTLVVTFTVGLATLRAILMRAADAEPDYYAGTDRMFALTSLVGGALVGFSILIAAVGIVNDLSMSVRRRARELGLLRALGLSVGQVRAMITVQAAQLAVASIAIGLLLGTVYGFAGAQSLLGSIRAGGMMLPSVPPVLVICLAVLGTGLTLVAALVPARRATRSSPMDVFSEA
jgi:putative ABC transport system permease protein